MVHQTHTHQQRERERDKEEKDTPYSLAGHYSYYIDGNPLLQQAHALTQAHQERERERERERETSNSLTSHFFDIQPPPLLTLSLANVTNDAG